MEYDQIKKLIEDMGNSNLTSINIEFPNGLKLNMEKNPNGKSSNNTNDNLSSSNINQVNSKSSLNPNLNANNTINNESIVSENNINNNQENNENKNVHVVKSPMVGTFYSKSAPDANPYVEVGSSVKEGDTLCIIEAMKLMNEIESEFTGKIYKILVSDGTPVEYGTPLFEIED